MSVTLFPLSLCKRMHIESHWTVPSVVGIDTALFYIFIIFYSCFSMMTRDAASACWSHCKDYLSPW